MKSYLKTILYHLALLTLLSSILVIGWFTYMIAFEGNHIIEYNGKMKVLNVTNENVVILLDYCKYKMYPAHIHATFVDGIIFNVPQENGGNLPLGCNKVEKIYKVPSTLPNGEYHLDVTVTFNVNPLKDVSERYESEKFVINK